MAINIEPLDEFNSIRYFDRKVANTGQQITKNAALTFVQMCLDESDPDAKTGPMYDLFDVREDDNGSVFMSYPVGSSARSIMLVFQRPFSYFQMFFNLQAHTPDISIASNDVLLDTSDFANLRQVVDSIASEYTPKAVEIPVLKLPYVESPTHAKQQAQLGKAEAAASKLERLVEEQSAQIAELKARLDEQPARRNRKTA